MRDALGVQIGEAPCDIQRGRAPALEPPKAAGMDGVCQVTTLHDSACKRVVICRRLAIC